MEHLPDDVLVMVMQYLSVDDLLACRLMCKRLADLALHREVWLHQRLAEDKPCVCAVLRLAPCLDSVVYSSKVHTSAFPTTRCAVRELILHVKKSIQFSLGGLVLRNQEWLGRLRRVELKLWWLKGVTEATHPSQVAAADVLLKILVACCDLESLVLPIGIQSPYSLSPVLHEPSRSSLKYFQCEHNNQSESFVNTVLAGHAATLEEVDLIVKTFVGKGVFPDYYKDTGDLIAGIPHLQRLKCVPFPGMQAVAACKMLRDLSIVMLNDPDEPFDDVVDDAAALLREADQLRIFSVEFQFCDDDAFALDVLLQALASSERSHVEQMTLVSVGGAEVLQLLLRVLPRLPALRHLVISESSVFDGQLNDELLPGITPDTAPALRIFEVVWQEDPWGRFECTHDWLHSDEVKNFLTVNPAVHIHIRMPYACEHKYCDGCSRGCHKQVSWNVREHQVGLFLHGPDKCPSLGDHPTGREWTWIDMRGDSI